MHRGRRNFLSGLTGFLAAAGCDIRDEQGGWQLGERRTSGSGVPGRSAPAGSLWVEIPVGVERGRLALGAVESLSIGPHGRVRGFDSRQLASSIASLGSLDLGEYAEVDSAYALGSDCHLRRGSRIHGFLKSSFPVTIEDEAHVALGIAATRAETSRFSWTLDADGLPGRTYSTTEATLQTGRYTNIVLRNPQVEIRPGLYVFDSLVVPARTKALLRGDLGRVSIWTRQDLVIEGSVVDHSALWNVNSIIQHTGETPLVITGRVDTVLVAPHCAVTLAASTTHEGSFYARSIRLLSRVNVKHRWLRELP